MNGDTAALESDDSDLGPSVSVRAAYHTTSKGGWGVTGKPPTGRAAGSKGVAIQDYTSPSKNQENGQDSMARWTRDELLGSSRFDSSMNCSMLNTSTYDSPLSTRSPRRSLHDSLSESPRPSRSRSPVRASHDLGLQLTSLPLDTDSGISNTLPSTRYRHHSSSGYVPLHSYQNGEGLQQSLDMSPRRYAQSECGHLDLERTGPVNNLYQALDQSEGRRHLLVDKLKDARGTMQQQAEKLSAVESNIKDAAFEVEDLRYREKEYRKKISALEQERYDFQGLRIENLRIREEMQEKIDTLALELRALRSSLTVQQQESSNKREAMDLITKSRDRLEEENKKLLNTKETMIKEMAALKESTEITRSRNSWLERQSTEIIAELEELRRENQTLSDRSKNSSRSANDLKDNNLRLKEENAGILSEVHAMHEEKHRLVKQSDAMQDVIADLQATLASTAADKERFFQEKLDLHQKVQNLTYDKQCLHKEKASLEDQVQEYNGELANYRIDTDRQKEEKMGVEEELAAVKKVSEVLSMELAATKTKLEKTLEQSQSLEQTKKIAFQQHELYEQEIKSLEQQIDNTKKSMTALQKDHQRDKDGTDEQTSKLKEEMRQLKAERTRMETKAHEMEARLKQAEHNLKEHSDMQLKELDSWQSNCEKMTATLTRKELEMQTMTKKIQELEEEANHLRVDHHSFQSQQDELTETKEESVRLQEENRRLLQERAENQQVIQLLEMQKSILAKASEGALNRVQDSEQLQSRIDELMADNNTLENRLKDLGRVRDTLIKEKEERLASGDLFLGRTPDAVATRVEELETQNMTLRDTNNMVTEKLTKMEKENGQLKKQQEDVVARSEHRRLEREKESLSEDYQRLRSQYNQLEETYHASLSSRKHRSLGADLADDADASSLRHEKSALESQTGMLKSQLVLLENGKKRAEDNVHKLEKQVEDLQQKAFESSHKDTTQALSLQKQVNQLQTEVDESKTMVAKQEAVIHALREDLDDEKTRKPSQIRQSLDDAGEELSHMRTELHKLMEVIQVKDQEIEGLEEQLMDVQHLAKQREQQLEDLRVGRGELDTMEKSSKTYGSSRAGSDNVDGALQKDRQDLTQQVCKLAKERDRATKDLADLNASLEDMKSQHEDELKNLREKMKKELSSRDRQIESLEEQLQHHNKIEIKKLKRDASKVELLKAENRRLQSELKKPVLPSEKTDNDNIEAVPKWLKASQETVGTPPKKENTNGATNKSKDNDDVDDDPEPETYASWDNDSVHEDMIFSESLTGVPNNLARELAQAEQGVLSEMQQDEDVKNVVNMLENVSLSSSLDFPSESKSARKSSSESRGRSGGGAFSAPWKRNSADETGATSGSSTRHSSNQQNGKQRSTSTDHAAKGITPRYRGYSTHSAPTSPVLRNAGTMTPKPKYDPSRPSSSATAPLSAIASRLRAENSEYLSSASIKQRPESTSSVSSSSASRRTTVRATPPPGGREGNQTRSPSTNQSTMHSSTLKEQPWWS